MIAALAMLVASCWPMPVPGPISVPYRAPACRWCAGHEAVGWSVAPGTTVAVVAPGRVVFAGRVAGIGYVSIDVGGMRTTYGGLRQPIVHVGAVVAAGTALGEASGLVTFSVRVDGVHVDPTPYFARPVGRARLVPVDGHRPRPWSATRSVCPAGPVAR